MPLQDMSMACHPSCITPPSGRYVPLLQSLAYLTLALKKQSETSGAPLPSGFPTETESTVKECPGLCLSQNDSEGWAKAVVVLPEAEATPWQVQQYCSKSACGCDTLDFCPPTPLWLATCFLQTYLVVTKSL